MGKSDAQGEASLLRGAHRLGHVRALVEGDLARVRVRVRARG